MKRNQFLTIFLALAMLFAGALTSTGRTFADESLNYKVMFKWGLVQKNAGTVNIRLTNHDDEYNARLTAKSDPWADRIFKLRDTLTARIARKPFTPLYYEKIANEGDERKHDIVRYSRDGSTVTGHCQRHVEKNGKVTKDETRVLQSTGTTVDMMSVFYYMRCLPFDSWEKGHRTTANIFSGKRKELLTIKYLGVEDVEYDKRIYKCYHITFTFTSDSGKKTSDDIDAWITTDERRLPVKLEGKLPVGKIHCLYTGG